MAGVSSGMSTLGRMGPHPRVQVSAEMDVRFGIDHKPCAAMGLPYLPGGVERSTLEPDRVLTCPGGWLDRHTKRREAAGREYTQRLQDTAKMSNMAGGGVVAEMGTQMIDRSASAAYLPGGGLTQGVRQLQHSASEGAYDPSKHGWYHPKGQEHERMLADQKAPGSWAWTMHKARDHNGFGQDGIVDKRDNTTTAVSEDAPHHFTGIRTLMGPWGTHKNPIRRCRFVTIDAENKRLKVQARTYRQGENMSIIETLHPTENLPPPPLAPPRKPNIFLNQDDHPNKHSNLSRSGAVLKKYVQPQGLGRLTDETPRLLKEQRAAGPGIAHQPRKPVAGKGGGHT